jgi:hypothetical protein
VRLLAQHLAIWSATHEEPVFGLDFAVYFLFLVHDQNLRVGLLLLRRICYHWPHDDKPAVIAQRGFLDFESWENCVCISHKSNK